MARRRLGGLPIPGLQRVPADSAGLTGCSSAPRQRMVRRGSTEVGQIVSFVQQRLGIAADSGERMMPEGG